MRRGAALADLTLGAGRPYALVTTTVHRGLGQCKLVQLDLHLTSGDVRLRFVDRQSLAHFCLALGDLAREAFLPPDPLDYRPVRTRLYTDKDPLAGTDGEQLLINGIFGTPFY
jgi:hypothetical protein